MIEEEEARAIILDAVPASEEEEIPIAAARGRIARRDVVARLAWPRFDNSAFDGYALGPGPIAAGSSFVVGGTQPAGEDRALRLGPGEAVRVFTGAPVPKDAVAVVMQEDVDRDGDQIRLHVDCTPGEGLRKAASDLCAGQILLSGGDRIDVGTIALLASQGIAKVAVGRRPRVGLVSTGDELVPPGSRELRPGEIHESNSAMLEALLGGSASVESAHVPDSPDALRELSAQMLDRCDLLFFSGGVSVGERDWVRPVLADLGVEELFWRIRLKPGKPLYAGRGRRCLVLGLPGNPASSFVCMAVFGLPAVERFQGAAHPGPGVLPCRAGESMRNPSDRPHYLRVRLVKGEFWRHPLQRSDSLRGLQGSALVRLEPGEELPAGSGRGVILPGFPGFGEFAWCSE